MDRLAVIIADMLKLAVSWEEEHGMQQHADNRKIAPQKPLTVIGVNDTLNASENVVKGEKNDHQD
jgi:hypothetical protein